MKKALTGTSGLVIGIILIVLMTSGIVSACHVEAQFLVTTATDHVKIRFMAVGFEPDDFVILCAENFIDPLTGQVTLGTNEQWVILEDDLPDENGWHYYTHFFQVKSQPYSYSITILARKGDATYIKVIGFAALLAGADDEQLVNDKFILYQNYPNPFNPQTTIKYSMPNSGHVRLAIHDILGREVAVLIDQTQNKGNYEVIWNAIDLPGGIYYYYLKAGKFSQVKKTTFLK